MNSSSLPLLLIQVMQLTTFKHMCMSPLGLMVDLYFRSLTYEISNLSQASCALFPSGN